MGKGYPTPYTPPTYQGEALPRSGGVLTSLDLLRAASRQQSNNLAMDLAKSEFSQLAKPLSGKASLGSYIRPSRYTQHKVSERPSARRLRERTAKRRFADSAARRAGKAGIRRTTRPLVGSKIYPRFSQPKAVKRAAAKQLQFLSRLKPLAKALLRARLGPLLDLLKIAELLIATPTVHLDYINVSGWDITSRCGPFTSGPYNNISPSCGDYSVWQHGLIPIYTKIPVTGGTLWKSTMFKEGHIIQVAPFIFSEGFKSGYIEKFIPTGAPNPSDPFPVEVFTTPDGVLSEEDRYDQFLTEATKLPYDLLPYWQPDADASHRYRTDKGPPPKPKPSVTQGDNTLKSIALWSDSFAIHKGEPHKRTPPKIGERETKKILNPRKGVALIALGGFTEYLDLISALYQGVPSEYKDKRSSFTDRHQLVLLAIWHNSMDWDIATTAILVNQIQDTFLGKLGKAGGVASGKLGLSVGIQTGPIL